MQSTLFSLVIFAFLLSELSVSLGAGHTSLKASLNRFNIVSTAECECGDGLQTEKHIFWDCKLYEEQRATMMAILSENKKKEYPKSVTELLRLEEKRFVQGVSYFINKIPIFI
jgi:hypothetical protein